jgi:hypothetical protein
MVAQQRSLNMRNELEAAKERIAQLERQLAHEIEAREFWFRKAQDYQRGVNDERIF